MNPLIENPGDWNPSEPADLIGPAALVARTLLAKARRTQTGGMRALLTGRPGVGKTSINEMVANALAANPVEIATVSGKDVTADRVREWIAAGDMRSLFGGVSVVVIEELDKASADGTALMLLYLDRVKRWPHRAVLASSNEDVGKLDPRFQSRFQFFDVGQPTPQEIERFLKSRCGVSATKAKQLAEKCDGDLRAAMLDAQSWLDTARATAPDLRAA